jgi:hypothetical protein
MKRNKETRNIIQATGVRTSASRRRLPLARLVCRAGLLVCLGGWLASAEAWTITNINIGFDSNSTAWTKVNNNNNNIAGALNAQAVTNAWFAGMLSNALAIPIPSTNGLASTNYVNAAITGVEALIPSGLVTNGTGSLLVTNAGTGNSVVITSGQVLINGFPALTNSIHAMGTPTISTNVAGEYARIINASGDLWMTMVIWFTNTPSATPGTKILTVNFAHAYANPPCLGYTVGLTSDGTYDGGMRPTLFVWGVSTTNATMFISSAAQGAAPVTGKFYTNYLTFTGQ